MDARSKLRISVAFALVVLVAGLTVRAEEIPVANAGFEDPPLEEGDWTDSTPGWTNGCYDLLAVSSVRFA